MDQYDAIPPELRERQRCILIIQGMAAERRLMARAEREEGGDQSEVDALKAQAFILERAAATIRGEHQ